MKKRGEIRDKKVMKRNSIISLLSSRLVKSREASRNHKAPKPTVKGFKNR